MYPRLNEIQYQSPQNKRGKTVPRIVHPAERNRYTKIFSEQHEYFVELLSLKWHSVDRILKLASNCVNGGAIIVGAPLR